MMELRRVLFNRKYELLLFALLQHLFVGVLLCDLTFYTQVIWPINMLILGSASIGVFLEKGRHKKRLRNGLFLLVLALPLSLPFLGASAIFMQALSLIYVGFFLFIFLEILQFLLKPSYLNIDIISAAACGYFLLIEISVFLFQIILYQNPLAFKGVDLSAPAALYMDLVYYCSITFTSIGFGDIVPTHHSTKLLSALIGLGGQFYSVVLVGILISKFTSTQDS